MDIHASCDDAKTDKKHRKRMKAVYTKIKDQMEFYFGDSNLHKDRFMKKLIDDSKDGYVDFEIFKKFNKIRRITMDTKVLAKALRKSTLLQVSDDGTKVKRIKPVYEPKNLDERTIYVECLPHHVDHEWIKHLFSSCGTVTYVSLPKYQSTGDPKGFAFVEFGTVQGAQKAIEELHNPPVEADGKAGKFPKSRKQLQQLQRRLTHVNTDEVENKVEEHHSEHKEKEQETKLGKKHKRHRRQTSESSTDGVSEASALKRQKSTSSTDTEKQHSDHSPVKKSRIISCDESDKLEESSPLKRPKSSDSDRQDDQSPVKKHKISSFKDSDKTNSEATADSGGNLQGNSHGGTGEGKREDNKTRKGKKRKQRSRTEGGQSLDSEADLSTDGEKDLVGKRRKVREGTTESEDSSREVTKRKTSSTGSMEPPSKQPRTGSASDKKDTQQSSKKKKRKKKKKHKDKDLPELRVISKKEWLELRSEYLALQKESMQNLKQTLSQITEHKQTQQKTDKQEKESCDSECKEEKKKKKDLKVEYVADVILKVQSGQPLFRKEIKEYLGTDAAVVYVDVKDGSSDGHIRFKDTSSAKAIADKVSDGGYIFSLLQGEDEKKYWDKLQSDREAKYSCNKKQKRGTQKLIDKAQKINKENVQRKHIVFDD